MAKRRRLNKRFLRILAASVLGVVALGFAAYKLKNRFLAQHPEKYVAAGREALAKKDYVTARDNFQRAAAFSHPDATLDVEIGDALNGLSDKDPDNVAAAQGMWEQALTIDPSNVPAMERLIHFWRDQVELHPRLAERAQAAEQLKKAADNLLKVDVDNHLGKANSAEATIETMFDGIPLEAPKINEAEEVLLGIESEDPADADIPYYVARACLSQAQEAARSDDAPEEARYLAKADRVMSDAVKDQPDNSFVHYRAGQILLQIAAGEMDNEAASAQEKDYISRGVAEIDLARQYALPDDSHYIDINLYDARLVLERPAYAPDAPKAAAVAPTTLPTLEALAQTSLSATNLNSASVAGAPKPGRLQVAETIYRDVLSHRPNDPATRIAYAELLGNLPGRRDEAIALLSQPLVDDRLTPGIRGTLLPVFQIQANMRLLSLEIDAVEAARDPQQRATLLSTADGLCDRVYGKNPDSPTVLGMKGRLELLHNRVVEATQTLKHALELTDPQDPQQQRNRYELMYHLARACEIAQQTGDAKKLASDIVAQYGRFIPARLMLARLLISEHDFAVAKPQIDFLESLLSSNPELTNAVIRMRVATLDPATDGAKIKGYFDRLPEETRDQKVDKAALARLVKFDAEFIRLLSAVHASAPGDAEAAGDLADWYVSHGQNPLALQVLQEALAVNPSDSGLIALQLQAEGKAPPPSGQQAGGGPSATDAFSNEVAQVEFARSHGDMAAVDQHLAAAEKLRPNDPRIWDAMFTRAMDVSNWDRASAYLEKLAAANVDHANGLLYRVHFALAKNDMPRAAELALQLTREKPEFSQSWCLLAQVQKAEGNYEDAIAHFQQAIELQTQNLEAIRGMVDCSYAQGNIDQAKRYIDMGRRVAPANDAFKELSLSYDLTYGDPQNVIGPRQEAMAAAPDNMQTWLDLASAYAAAAQSRVKLQDSAGAAGYTQKAKTLLLQGIAKFPDDSKFVATYAKLCVDTGDFPSAEQAMLNFTSRPLYKGRPKTAVLLSDFYELSGKSDQAAKVLSDYLASPYQPIDHAADVGAELHLASLFARQNRFDQALSVLLANAQEPEVIRQRVALLIDAHRVADAEKTLSDLAATGPLSPDLLTLKGVAALESWSPAKLGEARDCFDQVLAVQPNNSYALTQRAKVTLRDTPPNYSAALADLSRARDLVPGDMDTRLMIVEVDRHRNELDDAIHELESAVRLAPGNKRVRLTLIDLYAEAKPPRWSEADQLLRETKQIPSLAEDPDFLHEEAVLDRDRHEYAKALEVIREAMAKSPGNLAMVHTYYDLLLKTSAFDQLLSESAQLLSDHQSDLSLWWVYPYRAEATVRGSGDKRTAAAELDSGLNATTAQHDVAGTAQMMSTYAALIGFDAAVKVARKAQSDPHWLLLAADLCQQKGDVDASISWLEMALAKFDALSAADQDEVLHLGATEYLAKSPPDTSKAADMYRRIIKRSPDDVDALNNLACILLEPGPAEQPNPAFAPSEALERSEKAYNLMIHAGQDQPLIKDTYGWALISNKFNDQGLNMIRDVLGKADFAEAHYHLAEGLLKSQPPSPDDAASELAKAMKMLDQDERDGKPVDDALKSHVQEELHRARSGLAG